MANRARTLDPLDARLLSLLRVRPRQSLMDIARQLRVARGTVQARLDRLLTGGIVRGFGPDVDVRALGYAVQAFTTFEVDQQARTSIAERLSQIPQLLEAHIVTGPGDVWCRIVGTDNQDLQRVIDVVLAVPGVRRSSTVIALSPVVLPRVQPLVDAVAATD
jgi:DNA-binding Lrp family transcriptional regulator